MSTPRMAAIYARNLRFTSLLLNDGFQNPADLELSVL